ncbi:MAG TPA: hypothetical protein VFO25_02880 [Candidatus Eremiobacteraceae bacterium]|nr:hypothetical protein [Candidatus Eremiobacteraceae bacterium]
MTPIKRGAAALRALITIASALAACVAASCTVKSVPGIVTAMPLPSGAIIRASSLGQDGRLWFTYMGDGGDPGIGSIRTAGDGSTIELAPMAYGYAVDDIAVTPSGMAWLALACNPESSPCGNSGYTRFPVAKPTTLKIHRLGRGRGIPDGVWLDYDGSAWISDKRGNDVTHVRLDGRQTMYPLPDPHFSPYGLVGTKRAIYVVGDEKGKICVLSRTGATHWVAMPDPTSALSNLAAGPDGSVWVAEYDANKIVSVGADDSVRTYVVPTANSQPDAIAVDSSGVVWFTELDTDRIGQVTADHAIRDALLPYTLSSPIFVFPGPSQTLYVIGLQSHWFGLYRTFVVARIPAASAF